MPLTKRDIIDAIAQPNGYDKKRAAHVTETLIEIIKRTLESGDGILISGFGRFCIQHKKPRMSRNPDTNKPMKLRKRRIVTFRCSQGLRNMING
jgi:integration host factor subunit alpha